MIKQFTDLFESRRAQIERESSPLLNEAREAAYGIFRDTGFPAYGMEEYQHTDIGNLLKTVHNKDDLFCKVLQPLINALEAIFREHNSERNLSIDIFSDPSSQFDTMNSILGLIEEYTGELKLLWFYAEGSSLAHFKDTLVERQTETGMEYLRLMHDRYPYLNTDISPFFLHLASSFWVTLIGEMIRNTGFTREEKQQAFGDYIRFGVAGWKTLMQVEAEGSKNNKQK